MSNSYSLHITDGDPERVATLLPGQRYTTVHPLLHHPHAALRALGWTVRAVEWTTSPDLATARQAAAELLDGHEAPDETAAHLVVAKGLGTVAMPFAIQRDLPGVWLTPLLASKDAADLRDAATRLGEDHLMIGGAVDPHWDRALAARIRADYIEVPEADHDLEVPDDWRRNLETVEDLTAEIEYFAASFDAT